MRLQWSAIALSRLQSGSPDTSKLISVFVSSTLLHTYTTCVFTKLSEISTAFLYSAAAYIYKASSLSVQHCYAGLLVLSTSHHQYQYSIATLGSLCSLLHITNISIALVRWTPCVLYFTSCSDCMLSLRRPVFSGFYSLPLHWSIRCRKASSSSHRKSALQQSYTRLNNPLSLLLMQQQRFLPLSPQDLLQ